MYNLLHTFKFILCCYLNPFHFIIYFYLGAKGAGSSGSSSASSSVKQQPTSSKMSALKKKAKVADTKVAKRRYVRKKDKKM